MTTPHTAPGGAAPQPLPAAPGADQHPALALVNTRTIRPTGAFDDLAEPAAALDWLTGSGLLPTRRTLTPGEAGRLRALRECVRDLFTARLTGDAPDPAALAELNSALAATPFTGRLHWDGTADGPRLESRPAGGTPLDAALTRLARDAAELLSGPHAEAVAACGATGCIRYFLRTHGARQWCSQRCGDRVRAARHYARTRAAGTT
ncbi:ABATE domain-containing protein [Kitasatospora sp. NBC_00240]|uniref:CGNR zinc finger domain-containing protein n=1 Tax=Kitasatospora sp. NBC_00240 TaxID=2903567 RepID=UPI0022552A57|nr:CGNR zinc finger domain-containing protein [Kitasatospora sp. NBC_00240]MCX5215090.1 ABATE domain-containing protein [Kitasatospora sp. NBC_00240]